MGRELFTDAAVISAAAHRFDVSADALDAAITTRLRWLTFDGGCAGRDHRADGDALRHALDGWCGELHRWSRTGTEIAAALRAGARRYTDTDVAAASRVG